MATEAHASRAPASPFHEGERRVQARLGVRDIEPWARRVVRPYLPDEHRAFHTALPFLVAAARDGQARPWVTLLTGPEGFVRSPDPQHLEIDARPVAADALDLALDAGADVGLLGIELATRRRNRVNGRLVERGAKGLSFRVSQSFGNCPQYIHERRWRRVQPPVPPSPASSTSELSSTQQALIAKADTLFIASGHGSAREAASEGMDASHRGGAPGFVQVISPTELMFPDYAGNNHFNTIGNLIMDPRAALLFVDFEDGSMLHLTGRTRIDFDSDAVEAVPGARRLVCFDVEEAVELREALPLRWTAAAGAVRSLRLIDKRRESDDVTSFVFESRDGGQLPDFEAGQHLPIELRVPGHAEPVTRTYSLSNGPGGEQYRITVKRQPGGVASNHLHDAVDVGAFVDASSPAGDFVLVPSARPAVLLSAGVGITPMVSMLHMLAADEDPRSVWFMHGARDGGHHALRNEVAETAARHDRIEVRTAYSRPRPQDTQGADFDVHGRLNAQLVTGWLGGVTADFYLCGPTKFMAELGSALEAAGVDPDRIHSETFGPAS